MMVPAISFFWSYFCLTDTLSTFGRMRHIERRWPVRIRLLVIFLVGRQDFPARLVLGVGGRGMLSLFGWAVACLLVLVTSSSSMVSYAGCSIRCCRRGPAVVLEQQHTERGGRTSLWTMWSDKKIRIPGLYCRFNHIYVYTFCWQSGLCGVSPQGTGCAGSTLFGISNPHMPCHRNMNAPTKCGVGVSVPQWAAGFG